MKTLDFVQMKSSNRFCAACRSSGAARSATHRAYIMDRPVEVLCGKCVAIWQKIWEEALGVEC